MPKDEWNRRSVACAILVDEPLVRNVVHAILTRRGFLVNEVSVCVKPEVAGKCDLECCADLGNIDLMIVEVLVPRCCSGIEAARKVLRRWPGVRILLTSASPAEIWPADDANLFSNLPKSSCRFLPKPFTAFQLQSAIEELLGHPA